MNYELANELKDAGFPYQLDHYEAGIFPSLSELIEGCGDGFFRLEKSAGNNWTAMSGFDASGLIKEGYANCPTPEVAVAKLWLALQKK